MEYFQIEKFHVDNIMYLFVDHPLYVFCWLLRMVRMASADAGAAGGGADALSKHGDMFL